MEGDDIDRLSPEPYYLQLARLLERSIDAGAVAVGERLPGESELCRRYDLARSTVRETLRTLAERGRVRLVPRRGAYVVDPDRSAWVLQGAAGFFEGEVDHNGREVESEVVDAGVATLPERAASALGLPAGSRGFVLRRLRRLDGQLAVYSENHLPADLEAVVRGSEAMGPRGSLNRALRQAGHAVAGGRRNLSAVPAPTRVAALLSVQPRYPLLAVESVSWDRDRRPFDFYVSWIRTDVVRVAIEVAADEPAG